MWDPYSALLRSFFLQTFRTFFWVPLGEKFTSLMLTWHLEHCHFYAPNPTVGSKENHCSPELCHADFSLNRWQRQFLNPNNTQPPSSHPTLFAEFLVRSVFCATFIANELIKHEFGTMLFATRVHSVIYNTMKNLQQ